jgi:hypothetical protein
VECFLANVPDMVPKSIRTPPDMTAEPRQGTARNGAAAGHLTLSDAASK